MAIDFIRDDQVEVSDISTIAEHLFEPRDIVDMATTAGAVNILWMLKRDGTLISLSVSEEGVTGYATHKTEGFIESICSQLAEIDYQDGIPAVSGTSFDPLFPPNPELVPALFMTVIRSGVRVLEKLSYREDIILPAQMYADSAEFVNRALPLDLKNALATPRFLLSTQIGVPFAAGQVVNLQDVDAFYDFTVLLAGSLLEETRFDFFFQGLDFEGKPQRQFVRFIPTNVVDASNIEGYFEEDPPASLDAVPTRDWEIATNVIRNLNRFIGKGFLSVYADGEVLSSPLNPNRDDALFVDGSGFLHLPKFVREAVIGYPYETIIETLDLETADARTFTDVGKLISSVGLGLYRTKGGFVGQSNKALTDMEEYLSREDENLEEPTREISGHIVVPFPAGWEKTGRVTIKQVDPLPMTVLAVYPRGMMGE